MVPNKLSAEDSKESLIDHFERSDPPGGLFPGGGVMVAPGAETVEEGVVSVVRLLVEEGMPVSLPKNDRKNTRNEGP